MLLGFLDAQKLMQRRFNEESVRIACGSTRCGHLRFTMTAFWESLTAIETPIELHLLPQILRGIGLGSQRFATRVGVFAEVYDQVSAPKAFVNWILNITTFPSADQ